MDRDKSWLMESFDEALGDEKSLLKDSALVREIKDLGGRYKIGTSLGKGGQKNILSCEDKFTQRQLAMAVLRDSQKLSHNESFINEARIAAHLEHPNIVPLYDLGLNEDNEPYFTMKLLSGDNLQQKIEKRDLSLNEKLEVFLKVCDAMSYAHAQGIIHLDLKPDNIQVDDYGQVLVCDWGLAQKISEVEGRGQLKGSLGYMAPEQVKGESLSTACDIYALGGVLYALLSSKSPHSPHSPSALKERLTGPDIAFQVLSPEELKNIPKSLQAVFVKALSIAKQDRYQTVGELSNEIRAYIGGFATSAENPGLMTVMKKTIKRHKTLSVVLMSSVIFITVLTLLSILRINDEKKQADYARKKAELSELKSKTLLVDLNQEQRQGRIISDSAAELFFQNATNAYKEGLYKESFSAIEQVTQLNPELKKAWDLQGKLLFGMLRFREAQESLKHGTMDKKNKWLIELADLGKTSEGMDKPSARQIYDVRRHIVRGKYKFSGLHAVMFYNMVKNYNIEERWMFAEQSYRDNHRFFAKQSDQVNFKVSQSEGYYTVDASGNKGTRMTIVLSGLPIVNLNLSSSGVKSLNNLRGMPLRKLDISHTQVSSISHLVSTQIEELNIRDTQIFDLSPLRQTQIKRLELGDDPIDIRSLKYCKQLEYLEIPKNVYSEKLLEELKLTDKVVYR
ncbi:protein kinase [Lentisphaera profundi]|uniref:Protein kinase n=1 Tax=Lentisphaera profundi TaxID=1658616 RepID=A0ABY7VZM9_9BACT|nr:serine/threonine-protein kinase [Lentisphaera profundi]WDE99259.1 protein kinase [Lentisphaera profundi]